MLTYFLGETFGEVGAGQATCLFSHQMEGGATGYLTLEQAGRHALLGWLALLRPGVEMTTTYFYFFQTLMTFSSLPFILLENDRQGRLTDLSGYLETACLPGHACHCPPTIPAAQTPTYPPTHECNLILTDWSELQETCMYLPGDGNGGTSGWVGC